MSSTPPVDAVFIRRWLAQQQIMQEQCRFETNLQGRQLPTLSTIDAKTIEQKAREAFLLRRPDYHVDNLIPELLVERALREIKEGKPALTNGCCTKQDCPTTIFLQCIVDVLNN